MHSDNHFKINYPQITHETIDGETVILNLDTGSYYSIDKAGALIWSLIDAGASIRQIVEFVSRSYSDDHKEIEAGVYALVEKLEQEGLILASEDTSPSGISDAAAAAQQPGERSPFEFPNLHKYTDMEDLLLLDPIHDVDDAGWPNKSQDEK
jgi:hypothetical protein